MTKVITTAAIKGGTGKTATAGALAQAGAAAGKRILAIDLDPQSSLSIWLGADLHRPGSYDLIAKGTAPETSMQATGSGVFLMGGSANLTAIRTGPGSARRLERALSPILPAFDLILIDTAPAMGELQNNALYASTGLVIPLETDSSSLQGLYQIADIAHHIQQTNTGLKIHGTVITKYDRRPRINRFLRETIKEKGAAIGAPLLGEIRAGVAIREAMALQQSLFDYAPKSKPAQDYKALFDKIMEG